jgi:hypothetical protein
LYITPTRNRNIAVISGLPSLFPVELDAGRGHQDPPTTGAEVGRNPEHRVSEISAGVVDQASHRPARVKEVGILESYRALGGMALLVGDAEE